MFKHLEVFTMRAYFQAQEDELLPPFLGSTLRGILGHCMREFACIADPQQKCHLCHHAPECDYAQNFCTPGHEAGSVNPFVIHVPMRGGKQWRAGEICQFDITLIGKTVNSAGLFLDGLQAMAEQGWGARQMRFKLEQVTDQAGQPIWREGKTWLRHIRPHTLDVGERQARSVLVRFDSPTRVLVRRQVCQTLTFPQIIQSACRRIALLSHAYTGVRLVWDEEALLNDAAQIQTVEERWATIDFARYSMNRPNKLQLPAIEGWARYEGDLEPFTGILEAARRLHIGKNTTHGFGHYELSYDR